MENGGWLKVFKGHDDWVASACYSANSKTILSASCDQTIKEWDVESGHRLKTACSINKTQIPYPVISLSHDIRKSNPIRTFINIPGLFIQGCSFKNLHQDSDLSEESKELLRQYGGILED